MPSANRRWEIIPRIVFIPGMTCRSALLVNSQKWGIEFLSDIWNFICRERVWLKFKRFQFIIIWHTFPNVYEEK